MVSPRVSISVTPQFTYNSLRVGSWLAYLSKKKTTKFRGFSPQANYTDQATIYPNIC
jgi:hypothetical protein